MASEFPAVDAADVLDRSRAAHAADEQASACRSAAQHLGPWRDGLRRHRHRREQHPRERDCTKELVHVTDSPGPRPHVAAGEPDGAPVMKAMQFEREAHDGHGRDWHWCPATVQRTYGTRRPAESQDVRYQIFVVAA